MGAARKRIVVIGAGMGGLAAAIELARRGTAVTLVERSGAVGGKARQVDVAGLQLDAGPTVLTLVEVFEALFASAGRRLCDELELRPTPLLARHEFADGSRLDLFPELERSAEAVRALAGPAEAEGYLAFSRHCEELYRVVREPFIMSQRPRLGALLLQGPAAWMGLARLAPGRSLAASLRRYFRDSRLLQLYGRYATYVGSSPYRAPATLAVIAHVERIGVQTVVGGLHELACALSRVAVGLGVELQLGTAAEEILVSARRVSGVRLAGGRVLAADAVVASVDPGALAAGALGEAARLRQPVAPRSLSAVTWSVVGRARGFPLAHHNVLFSADYAREFGELFGAHELPTDPTLYVCAQDRLDDAEPEGVERLLVLANAPAAETSDEEVVALTGRARERLRRAGLTLTDDTWRTTTPGDFARLFPGSAGALYGAAAHGWRSVFSRPGARTRLRGLFLAGGGVHPGPGVPMAAQSGRLAAAAVARELGLGA